MRSMLVIFACALALLVPHDGGRGEPDGGGPWADTTLGIENGTRNDGLTGAAASPRSG